MNAYNRHACDVLPNGCSLDITTGSPWDILFLAGEVYAGASRGNFNPGLSSPAGQKKLALRCAMAILGLNRWRKPPVDPARFLVARTGGATIGAAFICPIWDATRAEGTQVIEYLAVQAASRHLGVGESLVRHVLSHAPARTTVQCWCAPESKSMIGLLRKLGFRQASPPAVVVSRGKNITWPAQWVWRNKAHSLAA